jgi:hypothetical protein
MTKKDVADFQDAVCVKRTDEDNLGELGSETRLAIQKALKASDQLVTDKKAVLLRIILRDRLKAGVTCPTT